MYAPKITTQSPRMQYSKLHLDFNFYQENAYKIAAADKNGQVNIKIWAVRQALLIYTRHQYIILGGYHHDPVMRKITLEC